MTGFRSIIQNCKTLFNTFYENSNVRLVHGQTNEVIYELDKTTHYQLIFRF